MSPQRVRYGPMPGATGSASWRRPIWTPAERPNGIGARQVWPREPAPATEGGPRVRGRVHRPPADRSDDTKNCSGHIYDPAEKDLTIP
jgi:hypothetical protein